MKKLTGQQELTETEKQSIAGSTSQNNKMEKTSKKSKSKMQNKSLREAKKAKNDDFYTNISDIEKEIKHYKEHLKGKIIYCNCDDPTVSNFFKYFCLNFRELGIKKLITTCYKNQNRDQFSKNDVDKAIYLEYNGTKNSNGVPDINKELKVKNLKGDGDFRSKECINLLKKSDIITTNEPFSLLREYVAQLMKYRKKFIIIGNMNAITYKEMFKLIKENKMWLGYTSPKEFRQPDGSIKKFGNINWYTNLEIKKRNEPLILYKKYNVKDYQKYDNYDAIEIKKTKDIPIDYKGVMGVPITFLNKYNPKQFEILGMSSSAGYRKEIVGIPFLGDKDARPLIKGKNVYARIFIKNKEVEL